MKKIIKKIFIALLAVTFVGSAIKITQQTRDYKEGSDAYAEAMAVANLPQIDESQIEPEITPTPPSELEQPPVTDAQPAPTPEIPPAEEAPPKVDPYAQALANADVPALQEVNPDVIGWISIPDTKISYPLLQGEDNDYYLRHTWNKARNSVGSIFMDYLINSDLSNFNTLIYGHYMRNGSMFGGLHRYDDLSFWETHPSVYIKTSAGVYQYDIFAAYEAKLDEITYALKITDDSTKLKFIQHVLDRSAIDTGVIPTEQDRIVTLVTCTGRDYSGRWVVQAVLR